MRYTGRMIGLQAEWWRVNNATGLVPRQTAVCWADDEPAADLPKNSIQAILGARTAGINSGAAGGLAVGDLG